MLPQWAAQSRPKTGQQPWGLALSRPWCQAVGLVTPYLQGSNNPEVFGQRGRLLLSWVVAKRWLPCLWPDCSGSAELPICSSDFFEGRHCSHWTLGLGKLDAQMLVLLWAEYSWFELL